MPAAPTITAKRSGRNVVINYVLKSSPVKPWLLITTVDGANDRYSPTSKRTVVSRKLRGTVIQPIALSQGELRVSASVRSLSGRRSRVVTVHVR